MLLKNKLLNGSRQWGDALFKKVVFSKALCRGFVLYGFLPFNCVWVFSRKSILVFFFSHSGVCYNFHIFILGEIGWVCNLCVCGHVCVCICGFLVIKYFCSSDHICFNKPLRVLTGKTSLGGLLIDFDLINECYSYGECLLKSQSSMDHWQEGAIHLKIRIT